MRIALCLSGQPRVVDVGYKCHKKFLLDQYDVDVFAHTWFDSNSSTLVESGGTYPVNETVKQSILDLYKPAKVLIEPQRTTFPGYGQPLKGVPIFAQYSMYYSIKQANELRKEYEREHNIQYDVIIRSRFDAGLLKSIPLEQLEDNMVYAVDAIDNPARLCDWFLFGKPAVMDIVSSVYDSIDRLRGIVKTFCGEELLWEHLSNYNLQYTKLYAGEQGSNLVLIRPQIAASKCWKSAQDVLNLI